MNLAPIVLFCYNRPLHVRQTLESLNKNTLASKSTLYIYSDGPKNEQDRKNVNEVRKILREKKWCGKVFIYESNVNIGLANSIVNGVTRIVNRYGKIVVLEDDLVLSKGFLVYMNKALNIYENENKVMHISGYMFPVKGTLPETFFLNIPTCWGWGTWKRAWKYFNNDANYLLRAIKTGGNIRKFNLEGSYDWFYHLKSNVTGSLRTWAVRWYASFFKMNGFVLHPGKSLVRNIGFDSSGEHCDTNEIYLNQTLADNIFIIKQNIIESKRSRRVLYDFYQSTKPNMLTRIHISLYHNYETTIFFRLVQLLKFKVKSIINKFNET
jgi:hypothetical protein